MFRFACSPEALRFCLTAISIVYTVSLYLWKVKSLSLSAYQIQAQSCPSEYSLFTVSKTTLKETLRVVAPSPGVGALFGLLMMNRSIGAWTAALLDLPGLVRFFGGSLSNPLHPILFSPSMFPATCCSTNHQALFVQLNFALTSLFISTWRDPEDGPKVAKRRGMGGRRD